MITYRSAKPEDMKAVAKLHKVCFPDYFLTSLGEKLLEKYYLEYLLENDLFILAQEADTEQLVGFCMGFYRGSKAREVFEKKNTIKLAGRLLILCLHLNRQAISRCWNRIFPKKIVSSENVSVTELSSDVGLLSICVSPDYRGTDVASRLVTEFENQSKIQTGQNCMLYVRSDNSRARHFYEKMGFVAQTEYEDEIGYIKYFT